MYSRLFSLLRIVKQEIQMAGRYDIVVFGATGFTGKHAVAAVERVCNKGGHNLTFAVAGRSKQKLQDTLRSVEKHTGLPVSKWPIILADVDDEQSLRDMAKKAKVVINCCGPFLLYGEPVVKACIAEGTHHIDVTGEPLFIDRLHLYQNDAAKEKGIYVISACGVDCIPTDMGVIFLQENFPGTLNSVELYADLSTDIATSSAFNIGTWRSIISHMANFFEHMKIAKLTRPRGIPDFKPKLKARWIPHTHPAIEKPACFFPSADPSVIEKTQAYLHKTDGIRPVQTQMYMVMASWFYFFVLLAGGAVLAVLSQIKFTRDLLLKYPQFFTLGFFHPEKEPSEEAIEKWDFTLTMVGQGWKDKLADPNDQFKTSPDLKIVGKVRGKNPGYGLTTTSLALCAKMILTEHEKMPKEGGVYSGGAAFAKTSLIKQLNENGVTFELTSIPTNV